MDDTAPRPSWIYAFGKWALITALIVWPLLYAHCEIGHTCVSEREEQAWSLLQFGFIYPLEIIWIGRLFYRLPYRHIAASMLVYFGSPILLGWIEAPGWRWPEIQYGTAPFLWRDVCYLINNLLPFVCAITIVVFVLWLIRPMKPAIRDFLVVVLLFPIATLIALRFDVIWRFVPGY